MFAEYEIKDSLIAALEQALEETGVPTGEGGWEVIARNPQVMTYGDKVILVDKVSLKRQGFQSTVYGKVDVKDKNGKVIGVKHVEREQWIEEIVWQVSAVRKRQVDDDVGTTTADDVLKKLVWWLNSRRGAAAMRGREDVPFAPVFTSATRSNVYEDDSDNKQIEESFDFKMIVLQVADLDSKVVDELDWETHPI